MLVKTILIIGMFCTEDICKQTYMEQLVVDIKRCREIGVELQRFNSDIEFECIEVIAD